MVLLAFALYLAVGISSALLIVKVSAALRTAPYGTAHVQHAYEAAFLAGGPARVTDAALAAMHMDGRIHIGGPGVVAVLRPAAHDPVEHAVLQALGVVPGGVLALVRSGVMRSPAVQDIGHGLAARGLMMPRRTHSGLARWGVVQGILCLIGLPLSVFATVGQYAGSGLDRIGMPFVVMALPALLPGLVIGLSQAHRIGGRVTPNGRRALRAFAAAFTHMPPSVAALVAVRGWRGLPDPRLRAEFMAAARHGAGGTTAGYASYTPLPWADDSSGGEPVWCAGSGPGSGCGSGGGSGGGSSCGSSGGGSSCSSSSGSSCGSSSGGSSCGSSS